MLVKQPTYLSIDNCYYSVPVDITQEELQAVVNILSSLTKQYRSWETPKSTEENPGVPHIIVSNKLPSGY